MSNDPIDEIAELARHLPVGDAETREAAWTSVLASTSMEPTAKPSRFGRLRRARTLVPVAAAYLILVPVATAVTLDQTRNDDKTTPAQSGPAWLANRSLNGCPKPSPDHPLHACVTGARTSGKTALYLRGRALDGARTLTIRYSNDPPVRTALSNDQFVIRMPVHDQMWASDARIIVTYADKTTSRTLTLDDLTSIPGFGLLVEHDYRRNNPCPAS